MSIERSLAFPMSSMAAEAALSAETGRCVTTVETVADAASLNSLEGPWDELVEEAGVDHPFLTHAWVRTWWECFGSTGRLHVLVARRAGRVVAIAPLMLAPGRMYGLRVRLLRSIHNVYTARNDLIVSPACPDAVAALWRHMRACRDRWDVVELCQLPQDSPTPGALARLAASDGYLTGSWPSGESPYIPIRGDWPGYLDGLHRKHRSNLRNRFKRLERLGPVEFRVVTSEEEVDRALQTGLRLEAAGWKGEAGTAIGCREDVKRFFTLLAHRAARRGWLRLHSLVGDGREIAFDYSMSFRGKLYLLKPAYDPAYAAYSPYNLLFSRVLQGAFEQKAAEFDLLGAADPWKLAWTLRMRSHQWLYIFPDAPWARAVRFAKFRAAPFVRRLRTVTPRGAEGASA